MFPCLIFYLHYSYKYSFSGSKKMVIQCKSFCPFREVSGISFAKTFYYQIFPYIDFLIKPALILLKPTRSTK